MEGRLRWTLTEGARWQRRLKKLSPKNVTMELDCTEDTGRWLEAPGLCTWWQGPWSWKLPCHLPSLLPFHGSQIFFWLFFWLHYFSSVIKETCSGRCLNESVGCTLPHWCSVKAFMQVLHSCLLGEDLVIFFERCKYLLRKVQVRWLGSCLLM